MEKLIGLTALTLGIALSAPAAAQGAGSWSAQEWQVDEDRDADEQSEDAPERAAPKAEPIHKLRGNEYRRAWAARHHSQPGMELLAGLGTIESPEVGGLHSMLQARGRFGPWQAGVEFDSTSEFLSPSSRSRSSLLFGIAFRQVRSLVLAFDGALGTTSYQQVGAESETLFFTSDEPLLPGANATVAHAGGRLTVSARFGGASRFALGFYGFFNKDLSGVKREVGERTLTVGGSQESGGGASLGMDWVL